MQGGHLQPPAEQAIHPKGHKKFEVRQGATTVPSGAEHHNRLLKGFK